MCATNRKTGRTRPLGRREISGTFVFLAGLILSLAGTSSPRAAEMVFDGGDGTMGSPYEIATLEDLDNIRNYLPAYFVLVDDIEASPTAFWNVGDHDEDPATPDEPMGWPPIVEHESGLGSSSGIDGQGHAIHGLMINRPLEENVGLLGMVWSDVKIKRLRLFDFDILGHSQCGTLAGALENAEVENITATGSVAAVDEIAGGLIGLFNGGDIRNCLTEVRTASESNGIVGGFLGKLNNSESNIINCRSRGDVLGGSRVGGLIGHCDAGSNVDSCQATGLAEGMDYVGGLIGESSARIKNCRSGGGTAGRQRVGGLIGYAVSGSVESCCSACEVTGEKYVGGLIGYHGSYLNFVAKCCSEGNVSGKEYIGGFLGAHFYGKITDCYASGNVEGERMVGGFSSYTSGISWPIFGGAIGIGEAVVKNCYFSGAIAGDEFLQGLLNPGAYVRVENNIYNEELNPTVGAYGAMGLTIAQMKRKASFPNFDFNSVWSIDENESFPYFSNAQSSWQNPVYQNSVILY